MMDENTLTALRGSIAKWEAIASGSGEDMGHSNCPLCQMFARHLLYPCLGCPVHKFTGERHCEGTPYDDWLTVVFKQPTFKGDQLSRTADTDDKREAAMRMVFFLTRLLPDVLPSDVPKA